MKWTDIIKDYLTFSKKTRSGAIIVLLLLIIIIFLPIFITSKDGQQFDTADTTWIAAVKKLEKTGNNEGNENSQYENERYAQYDRLKSNYIPSTVELFYFDPNTLSKEEWQKLGLRDKTIQTIQNYLSKGGRFKKAEDLQKVYGLRKIEYDRLAPYAKIQTDLKETHFENFAKSNTNKSGPTQNSTFRYSSIDINTADTSAFIALPGIGSKLATRIINFRDKLGGFYTIEQVKETFGLPDSTFQKIKQYLKLENSTIRKININTATIDELKAHPYIKYVLANPIVAYRNTHGPFSTIDDLKKIMIITDEVYTKISPYLAIQ